MRKKKNGFASAEHLAVGLSVRFFLFSLFSMAIPLSWHTLYALKRENEG